ncbi:MAG: ROK family protein [Candidatus Aenigmarchaeota archaeon]|nr:ROK family protein [Candidatus Aenigmarchaeota archaeon]
MSMNIYYAIDIGGTKTDAGLIADGKILRRKTTGTPKNPNKCVEWIYSTLEEFTKTQFGTGELDKKSIKAAGIGAPDIRGGGNGGYFEHTVPNLPRWRNFDLKGKLQDLGIPIRAENDTDAAAMAALLFDKYNEAETKRLPFLYITVSTGLGAGLLVADNSGFLRIFRNEDGSHPELAHMEFPGKTSGMKNVRCGCGAVNCLESYAGGKCIEKRYSTRPETAAQKIKDEVAENLGRGLCSMIISYCYYPRYISIGGGIAYGWGASFINKARDILVLNHRMNSCASLPSEIRLCGLGSDVGLLGASAVAMQASGKIADFLNTPIDK